MLALPGTHHSTRQRAILARSFDGSGEKIAGKNRMFFKILAQQGVNRVFGATILFPGRIDLLDLLETGEVLKLLNLRKISFCLVNILLI